MAQTRADRFFTGSCDFIAGAADDDSMPKISLPEIALAGRSNVGKSSLFNALTGKRAMAKVSNTPGRTQQLNFFRIADRLHLVDVPGYGFAKAPLQTQRAWQRLLDAYLRDRPTLRRVVLLIDARHGLVKADHAMLATLDAAAVPYQVVLTKSDYVKPAELAARLVEVAAALKDHPAALPEVMATSSAKGDGIAALRAALFALL